MEEGAPCSKKRRCFHRSAGSEEGFVACDEDGSSTPDPRSRRHSHDPARGGEPLLLAVRSSWFPPAELSADGRHRRDELIGEEGGEDLPRIRDRIESLSRQLSLAKRRLGPSAARCAAAVDAAAGNRGREGEEAYGGASREFQDARRACNPYERLGEGRRGGLNDLFMNRSAIKLANVDALVGFRLAEIGGSRDGNGGGGGREEFRFADLCGAPGGFSEYLLRRCRARRRPCRGYGMSLRGRNDQGAGLPWRLGAGEEGGGPGPPLSDDGPARCQRFRICHGADGTGDVCNWKNVEHLKGLIRADALVGGGGASCCGPDGDRDGRVHLVVADGGVDAQRDADHQEALTQKLVACQASAALELVAPGGTVVLKTFGFRTDVVRGVVQDMARRFDSTTALKPISSRPASAERYLVFSGFRLSGDEPRGLQWQSRVFLGDLKPPLIASRGEQHSWRLRHYLDLFDLDMLELNLKTCFSILSFLERKCRLYSEPNDEIGAGVDATIGDDEDDEDEATPVNIAAYRRAWHLE